MHFQQNWRSSYHVLSNSVYYSNLCWDEGCGKLNKVRKFSDILYVLPKKLNTYSEVGIVKCTYYICTFFTCFPEQKELISCRAKNTWLDISFWKHLHNSVSSVMEFISWWVKISLIFEKNQHGKNQNSTYSKETCIDWITGPYKEPNLTFSLKNRMWYGISILAALILTQYKNSEDT